ncbi:MAG TPA: AAA family ATPase, partial [Vicinamibacterales bacterium]|nr:AAA family ATPase [Vicinamibacterales bacterium]
MLRFLAIRNLAVIERLQLEFEPGLNVLTGETGAGKSIVVGAVGLLVGGRASADLVRTGADGATVEGLFDEGGREVLLRREISAQGRSRAFIDGSLATSAAVREVSGALVDLHGQHEHQVLLDPASHLDLLDRFAGADGTRSQVATTFTDWERARVERARLAERQRETAAKADYLAFQLAEIEKVAPKPGEDEEVAATRQVLANADRLQRLCAEAYDALYDGDEAALRALGQVWRRVADLAAIDERFAPHLRARDAIKPQLEDLAHILRSYSAGIDAAPERLQEVEDRLAALERLKKKHGPSLADVLARAVELRRSLDEIAHGDEAAGGMDATLARARDAYCLAAGSL